jgi:hypothetical protein
MRNRLLLGLLRHMLPIPRKVWQGEVSRSGEHVAARLAFMSEEHHQVRNFVVLEIPRVGAPLSPAYIADALDLPLDRVVRLLDELEVHMTFLFRNDRGEVSWAYPVTADETPHHVTFHTGEEIYAA